MTYTEEQARIIEAARAWLRDHKEAGRFSWTDLGRRVGIASGTLSQFGGSGYAGDEAKIAAAVDRYREGLAVQASIALQAPDVPSYYETPTSRDLLGRYGWAQRGKMVAVATGPGTGKTITARHYQETVQNVWIMTAAPSSAGVNTMQVETLAVLGERDAKGTPQALSRRILERVRNTGGLLIFDEAQHLSERAIEEIRGWYDAVGIGIVLQGNESVISRLEGGSRKAAFAQLYSRISMRLVRPLPTDADAEALSDAWRIEGEKERAFIRRVALMPGGLRGCTMMLELASLLAAGDGVSASLTHMEDAWSNIASRPVSS